MHIREMTTADIPCVLPLYIDYYNTQDGSCWTAETADRRIRQVLGIQGAYALLLEDQQETLGFVMGYFKQYDDLVGYTLEEIIIARAFQHKGLGSRLLADLEQRVSAQGAACVEL